MCDAPDAPLELFRRSWRGPNAPRNLRLGMPVASLPTGPTLSALLGKVMM